MSKIDKSQLKESQVPNSRSRKKVEHKNAQKALEDAKKRESHTFFVKQGDCQFSRKLKIVKIEDPETEKLYNVQEAAVYLGLIHPTFYRRSIVHNLQFTLISGRKYFSQEILDDHKKNTTFLPRKKKSDN